MKIAADSRCRYRVTAALALMLSGPCAVSLLASPAGGTVSQGTATFTSQGPQFTITTSDRAFINWQSFNIGLGETTTFVQPSATSLVWNRINDPNPSQILGTLNANGYVVLQNQSGFFIGGQAVINTHGLLMTTAPIPAPDLSSGGAWQFNAPPPTASIINYGQINVGNGASAFLIAHDIENHGSISAPQGNIGLYAGQQVLMSQRPDGRGLSARVTLPEGSVNNQGQLIADAGTIAMNAQVVNQGGVVQANSIREVNGVIELVASDAINLGANSVLSAHGDSQGNSPGGTVSLKSGHGFSDQPASLINVSGGAQGGNGGDVEISAATLGPIHSTIQGHAPRGFFGGALTIDPYDLTLDQAFVSSLTPIFNGGLYQINLQANHNIELSTLWTLSDPGGAATVTLTAGNNITLDDGSGIAAGHNWSVAMSAGPLNLSSRPPPGSDGIYLNGSSYIQTQNGNISLWAANEVKAATGPSDVVGLNGIRTLDGGSIDVTTRYGDVNAGGNWHGFDFNTSASYYTVSPILGGISTAAGGDVTIRAGGDVLSYLPLGTSSSSASDGGTGAFGSRAGDVTIVAGGSVYGHYVVANGQGTITAGENAGAAVASQNIALSLISGSWQVNAPHGRIYLQEVRNPNGIFNNLFHGRVRAPGYHFFDYDPHSSVDLTAGIGVYLTGQSVPRPYGGGGPLYPPTLTINAGADGVVLSDSVILFPSPYGELHITTTAGGNFANDPNSGNPNPQLIMSDSSSRRWVSATSFGAADRGDAPIELLNPNPVLINISGNMQNVGLITTKQTRIAVGGDMVDCSFSGQNLNPGDVTSITVAGQIFNRSPYSFLILNQSIPGMPASDLPPNTASAWDVFFSLALDASRIPSLAEVQHLGLLPSQWGSFIRRQAAVFPSNPGFTGNPGFVYNPTTRRLGFSGQMSPTTLAELVGNPGQTLTVLRYGADGNPIVDSTGHFVTDQVRWADPSAVQALYAASQGAPSPSTPQSGYQIGGPGLFDVHARSISLGNSYGILSWGVGSVYANLAHVTQAGASVNVTVDNNLDMLTSTIAALGGGDVTVTSSGGSMDLGSQELFGNAARSPAFGIFTSGRGNVNVTALDDININGSRIAAYNGGNISVMSLEGNVNAGNGGTTFVSVPVAYTDPATGMAAVYQERVFGSGIVATTLVDPSRVPGSSSRPGDILVETPRGSIFASLGGILQEALNGNVSAGPTITLVAGTLPSAGSPGFSGSIDLGDSGVIGGTVNLQANGNINGLVISRQNSTINAAQSFSGTVLSGGTANLSAGGTVSGTVIGIGGVNASGGGGITATLLGQSVSVGGGQAQSTLGTTAAATSTSQAAAQQASAETQQQVAKNTAQEDDSNKKNAKGPTLTRRVGRVTVILPTS